MARPEYLKHSFQPMIVLSGQLMEYFAPLEAEPDERPQCAQLYLIDPRLESSTRVEGLRIPTGYSEAKQQAMKVILQDLQRIIHELNPYVKDFKQVIEHNITCLLYTSPSPRDKRQSRMPSSA